MPSIERQYTVLCSLPPGAAFVDVPGTRYNGDRHGNFKACPEHVQDLEAAGCHIPRPAPEPAPPVNPASLPIDYPRLQPGQKLFRMLPPPSGALRLLQVEGRPYDGTSGKPVDAPESDSRTLIANGWLSLMEVLPPKVRPAAPARGEHFLDTTLGADLVFDGSAWRHSVTGAKV